MLPGRRPIGTHAAPHVPPPHTLQAGLAGLSFDEGEFGVCGYIVKARTGHHPLRLPATAAAVLAWHHTSVRAPAALLDLTVPFPEFLHAGPGLYWQAGDGGPHSEGRDPLRTGQACQLGRLSAPCAQPARAAPGPLPSPGPRSTSHQASHATPTGVPCTRRMARAQCLMLPAMPLCYPCLSLHSGCAL